MNPDVLKKVNGTYYSTKHPITFKRRSKVIYSSHLQKSI